MKNNQLTVTEVLKRDEVQLINSNTMIFAPVGSGKSYLIKEVLSKKAKGEKLLLVSTRSLKDANCKEGMFYTTQDVRRRALNVNDENIYIMTYAEYGKKTKWDLDSSFISKFEMVFCDEIHSLFDYYISHKTGEYLVAILSLFKKYEDKRIFYFTATPEMIEIFVDKECAEIYKHVTIYDYRNDAEIKKNGETIHETFCDSNELEEMLEKAISMKKIGEKGLIFNGTIKGMMKIESILESLGFSAITIWSKSNKNKMTKEQLKVLETLLETGMLPDEYDFLIINEAMREGWELKDERVQVVVINDTSETNIVQARGRVRHNISLLITKEKEGVDNLEKRVMRREKNKNLFESVLDEELTAQEIKEICVKLNVKNGKKIAMFPTIQPILEKNGYSVKVSRKVIEGKKVTVYKISKVEVVAKRSEVSKSKIFLSKMGQQGLFDKNEKFFERYMSGKGKSVALSNLVTSYNSLVLGGTFTEEIFELATFEIIKSNNIFTKKFYLDKAKKLNKTSDAQKVKLKLEVVNDKKLEEEVQAKKAAEEEELLRYILENS